MNHELVGELFYNGKWNRHAVYSRDGFEFSRGAGGEDETAPPASASATFANRDDSLSPRNPSSALFGVAGRNTPMRFRIVSAQTTITDTFTRSATDSWGASTGGGTWQLSGSTGTNADFDVTGSAGTVVVGAAPGFKTATLTDQSFVDCEVYVEVTVAAATGGALEPTVMLRRTDSSNYYMCRINLFPASGIDVAVRKNVAGVDSLIATEVNVSSHTAAQAIKIRAQIAGRTIQVKAWQGSSEPDWQLAVQDDDLTAAGAVGLRFGRGTGNTNASALFTVDNFEADPLNIRSTTEIASWGLQRHNTGRDKSIAVQGGGILRRFGQGSTPVKSVAYSAYMAPENDVYRLAYWPLEEESDATAIGSPAGSPPMGFGGSITFGGDTDSSYSSARLITLGSAGFLFATVPGYTSAAHKVHLQWTLPDAGLTDQAIMMRIYCTGGSIAFLDLVYGLPNALTLKAYSAAGSLLDQSGPWGPFLVDGNHFLLTIDLTDNGGSCDTILGAAFVDNSPWLAAPDTFTSQTVGRITYVTVGQTDCSGASVGHLAVGNSVAAAFFNFIATEGGVIGLQGYRGERAGVRFLRLAAELGLSASVIGDPDDTQPMGPQPVDTGDELLTECIRTDDGILLEPRNDRALVMRTGRSRYNQDPALELDYGAPQISPGITPVLDDRHTRNDVTANRPNGSSARAEKTSGPMNVNDPIDDPDGVGRYETAIDVNTENDAALIQHATWHLAKGTLDELRYPQITVDLDRATSLRAAVDEVEIGDRITVDNLPTEWQQEQASLLVLGISESFPPGTGGRRRTVTFNTIPASAYEIGIVGANDGSTDLRGQAVDTDNSTLNEVLDTTETGVDVASTGGVVWTTNSNDWSNSLNGSCEFGQGLFIIIGGEVMRVTNITGASSPQTFTVVRSVNGVVKEHALGTPVHVYRPVRIGL